jgi:hypothetical protein
MSDRTPRQERAAAACDGAGSFPQTRFRGTANPRALRLLHALRRRSMPREQVDREAGCSNGPALIADLRDKGLELPCTRVPVIDRDGREVRRGVYHLSPRDRGALTAWIRVRDAARTKGN